MVGNSLDVKNTNTYQNVGTSPFLTTQNLITDGSHVGASALSMSAVSGMPPKANSKLR